MKNIELHASENVNKILLGNKCDLVEKKVVDTQRGQQLADEYEIKFLETSAKNNINVEEAFFTIARDIKKRLIDSAEPVPTNNPVNINQVRANAVFFFTTIVHFISFSLTLSLSTPLSTQTNNKAGKKGGCCGGGGE